MQRRGGYTADPDNRLGVCNNTTPTNRPISMQGGRAEPVKEPAFKCFKCGEPGHKATDSRKSDRQGKNLFTEGDEDADEGMEDFEGSPLFDNPLFDNNEIEEEVVHGARVNVYSLAEYALLLKKRKEMGG
ncbi:hypothetical protein FRX31_011329 [Thalictrum thalictroides]|uniref:CCHC-type domain-containing protein n=1 Tax=Thalictrum thalictroides TaxID=46969 RepID=A0A7J6WR45_THATH|nr:hypothetical protein FRX31_011329 [Thalictrum thalictroides]